MVYRGTLPSPPLPVLSCAEEASAFRVAATSAERRRLRPCRQSRSERLCRCPDHDTARLRQMRQHLPAELEKRVSSPTVYSHRRTTFHAMRSLCRCDEHSQRAYLPLSLSK